MVANKVKSTSYEKHRRPIQSLMEISSFNETPEEKLSKWLENKVEMIQTNRQTSQQNSEELKGISYSLFNYPNCLAIFHVS